MEKKREVCPPVLFPNSKVRIKFNDFVVLIESSVHGVCDIEHNDEKIYLTLKKLDAFDFKCNF